METLRNKDEHVQRENMGLRVSGLESLTLLCPSPAVRSGQAYLHSLALSLYLQNAGNTPALLGCCEGQHNDKLLVLGL